MVEQIEEKLKKIGLTATEARVYLTLLESHRVNASAITKTTGLDRVLTYQILNNLVKKGLAHYVIKSGKKFFSAANPENLLNKVKEQEAITTDLIKELKKIKSYEPSDYDVQVYEGKDGLRSFFRLLTQYSSMSILGATGRAYDLLYELEPTAHELSKKRYSARIITSPKHAKHPISAIKGTEVRYLDVDGEATTSIFGDYISIHLLNDKPIVIVIKNKDIAKTYLSNFDILWNIAKK